MEPAEYCAWARQHLDDWVPEGCDQAAVAVLLAHFARARPSDALFAESLRALARDRGNGSLASAATAIYHGWRAALARARSDAAPLTLRPDDVRAAPSAPSPPNSIRPAGREAPTAGGGGDSRPG
jgi:hypothetical protein